MNPRGVCALCRQVSILQDSHLMSKALYKLLRSPELVNPHPTLMSTDGILETSRQPKVEDAGIVKTRRKMSAAARKRIANAQELRWAAFHARADADAEKPAGKTAAKATTKKALPAKTAPKKKLSAARKKALVANLAKARAAKAAKKSEGEAVPF